MTVADLSGTVRTFATRKRFYAVVYLNTKKDEAIEQEFLSSFVLPEKLAEPAPTVAAAPPAAPPTPSPNQPTDPGQTSSTESPAAAANSDPTPSGTEPKLEEPDASATQPKKRRPITGGVLNGKAITLPKPDYPTEAREAKAAGQVVVQVTIDESGIVTEAKAVSGHPLLVQAAVNAALQARFSPTLLMGEPVKVSGMIVYNFVRQ